MKKLILIVDDTPDLLEGLSDFLRMEGFQTLTAANGSEGLHVLGKSPVDLIITDLLMPVMDGMEFVRQVKNNVATTRIPIIVYSAKPEEEIHNHVLTLGANRFIGKPGSLDNLLTAVLELTAP